MRFNIERCGPIQRAGELRLRPLTIFVGPNDTGKSYLATLVYALLQGLQQLHGDAPRLARESLLGDGGRKGSDEVGAAMECIWRLADEVWEAGYIPGTGAWNFTGLWRAGVPCKELADTLEPLFRIWAAHVKRHFETAADRCFGMSGLGPFPGAGEGDPGEPRVFKTYGPEDTASLNLAFPQESHFKPWKETQCKCLHRLVEKTARGILSQAGPHSDTLLQKFRDSDEGQRSGVEALGQIFTGFHEAFVGTLQDSHYLPAGRSQLMQSFPALNQSLLQGQAAHTASSPQHLLNGVSSDFLLKLLGIGSRKYAPHAQWRQPGNDWDPRDPFARIGADLERQLLNGHVIARIRETKETDFLYYSRKYVREEVSSIQQASSLVSGLAPLSLFIRHYLGKDSFLFIEEPEAQLHPKGQRLIAEVLVRLAKAGLRVLITTHSSLLVEQISHFVHASHLRKSRRKSSRLLGEAIKERTLPEQDVATYSFVHGTEGSVVRAMPFDEEKGFLPADHLQPTSALHNEFIDLLSAKG